MQHKDATPKEIDSAMQAAEKAFSIYKKIPLRKRAEFMKAIAAELEEKSAELVHQAMQESHLGKERLKGELDRTIFQLTSYAAACEEGSWLDARINKADPNSQPPKPDIRKTLVPLGPVVVFGASNFPFAYSTAGGDTACAFAAGCPVVVKAHPAHAATSELVSKAIFTAIEKTGMPPGIFAHLHGEDFDIGKALVQHELTKAVGFTGSFAGGKQLFDWGNSRKVPIPVFAEMGSVNPVFLLPKKLAAEAKEIAEMYAASITLSVGQFCTNPGIIIGIAGKDLELFKKYLQAKIENTKPATMLHPGIAKSFIEKREKALNEKSVSLIATGENETGENQGQATLAAVDGKNFLENNTLHQEVFGPYSLIVSCADKKEMLAVAKSMEGQLTSTIMAADDEIAEHEELIESIKNICGRFIMNGVPTGVEVCLSQHHGGPYPATTDSRFTAVGADGIKRFARPIAFQNWKNEFLPDELKDENPWGVGRRVGGV